MNTLPALIVALLAPTAAHAQVVNTLPLITKESEEGLDIEATGGGSLLTGNAPLLSVKGALLMRYRAGRHTVISSSSAEFGRTTGDPFLNRQLTHLRYQHRLADAVTWEAYAQAAHDEVWRLKLRALGGTGLRFDIERSEHVDVRLGVAYMFEHERLSTGAEFGDSGLQRYNHRLSTYGSLSWRIDQALSLQQSVFFQPRFDAPTDLRLLSRTALVTKAGERFALSTTLQVAYNTWTPETVLPLDTTTSVELTLAI